MKKEAKSNDLSSLLLIFMALPPRIHVTRNKSKTLVVAPSDYFSSSSCIPTPYLDTSLQFQFKWPLDAPAADFDRVDAVAQRLRAYSSPH